MNFIENIQNNVPFVFAKFGDGEYNAVIRLRGENCDGTPYTEMLGQQIHDAFLYLTQFPNVYIGKWADFNSVAEYWIKLAQHPIHWADYNLLICRSKAEFLHRGVQYFRAIRNAPQQKIYVCNYSMVEMSRELLKIDDFAVVDPVHWFEKNYDGVLNDVCVKVTNPENLMILTSAGMGAKPLIADLWKKYPKSIIIDVGSALDAVCSLRKSRDYHNIFTMEDIQEIRAALFHS